MCTHIDAPGVISCADQGKCCPCIPPQELARAVHGICNRHSIPAIHAALESAVQQASQHACEAATAACKALLPVDIPPAAAAAAAALVATSCKASCAQKLLQEVGLCGTSASGIDSTVASYL